MEEIHETVMALATLNEKVNTCDRLDYLVD